MFRVVLQKHATSLAQEPEVSEPDSQANLVRHKRTKRKQQIGMLGVEESVHNLPVFRANGREDDDIAESRFSYATGNYARN